MFKNLISDFFSKTPQKKKELRNLAILVVGVSTALVTLPVTAGIALPAIVISAAKSLIVIGAAIGINAQTHKEE